MVALGGCAKGGERAKAPRPSDGDLRIALGARAAAAPSPETPGVAQVAAAPAPRAWDFAVLPLAYYQPETSFGAVGQMPLFWRLEAAAFGAVGNVYPDLAHVDGDNLKPAGGLGLRLNVGRRNPVNIRLDGAIAPGSAGVYLVIGEAI
jgi:hypothetical protein